MPETLEERINAIERLTVLFKTERMVYLSITFISLLMLLGSAVSLIIRDKAGAPELTLLFGSSGLITYTAGRLLFMWSEALKRIVPHKEDRGAE